LGPPSSYRFLSPTIVCLRNHWHAWHSWAPPRWEAIYGPAWAHHPPAWREPVGGSASALKPQLRRDAGVRPPEGVQYDPEDEAIPKKTARAVTEFYATRIVTGGWPPLSKEDE